MKICVSTILKNDKINEDIFKLVVDFSDDNILPGQFFMLKTLNNEFLLPRPISINDFDEKTATFLYRTEGFGTGVVSRLKKGDEIQLFGPLGNGFDVEKLTGKIALIGGGIGIAPLFKLAKSLKEKPDIYLGFRDEVYEIDEFAKHANKLEISTEDGSVGKKGYVTSLLDFKQYDVIVTCGPDVMMEAIMKECEKSEVKCIVSLEKRMACGIGACLGCVVETTSGMKRVCKEGPVFEMTELVR